MFPYDISLSGVILEVSSESLVEVGKVVPVLLHAEFLVLLVGFGKRHLVGDVTRIAEDLLVREVEELLHLHKPVGHLHDLPIQGTQLGKVNEHGDQAVELGDLHLVQVVFGDGDVALQYLSPGGVLPRGKPHVRHGAVGAFKDDLRRCLSRAGEVEPVLHGLIEKLGLFAVAAIVAAALFENVGDLLVGPPFTGANLPNLLQKFIEVVPAKGAAIFEHLVVENKALHHELPERIRGPDAEVGGLQGVDAVTHGDDGVQIIKLGLVRLAISGSCFHFGNNCRLRQFLGLEDVLEMFGDCGNTNAEEFGDGALRKPEVVLGEVDVDGHSAVGGIVEDDAIGLSRGHEGVAHYRLRTLSSMWRWRMAVHTLMHAFILRYATPDPSTGQRFIDISLEVTPHQASAEIDLLLEIPGQGLWAIEIKRSLAGRPEKGVLHRLSGFEAGSPLPGECRQRALSNRRGDHGDRTP